MVSTDDYYDKSVGTTCTWLRDTYFANVVCRQIYGANHVGVQYYVPNDSSGGIKPWISHINCNGDERNLAECDYYGWDRENHNCAISQDRTGVECVEINM